jgi:hypothetical protein
MTEEKTPYDPIMNYFLDCKEPLDEKFIPVLDFLARLRFNFLDCKEFLDEKADKGLDIAKRKLTEFYEKGFAAENPPIKAA